MFELFRKFMQLTLLKVTPQELPGHYLVLWISVAAAFFASLAGLLFAYDLGDSIMRSSLALAIPAVLVYAMLGVRNLQSRFVQVYSALCGSAAVIYLIALPLMPGFFAAIVEDQPGKIIITIVLLLDLWTLAITAHILKHAFDVGFPAGFALALALMLATLLTIEAITPALILEQATTSLQGGNFRHFTGIVDLTQTQPHLIS